MRRLHFLVFFFLAVGCFLTTPANAQDAVPSAAPPIGKPPVNVPPAVPASWLLLQNEYIAVAVNRGQFYIFTTGGDPSVQGDEGQPLLYPNATSFVTYRDRLEDPFGPRNWHYTSVPSTAISNTDCQEQGSPGGCFIAMTYHLGCQRWATQRITLMRNPYTQRRDMVRISYTFEQEPTKCTNVQLNDTSVGVRLLLDTMVGSDDAASFFVPGQGNVTTELELTDSSVPAYFRVFADPNLAPDSLQALGYLHLSSNHTNTPWPSKFQIASWFDLWDTEWQYETRPDKSHGDSAIAVYWPSYKLGIGEGESLLRFELGYGLAPRGGGDMWSDAPVTVNDDPIFDADTWVHNRTNAAYNGGKMTLSLPSGMVVRPLPAAAGAATTGNTEQAVGDLAPGATTHVRWPLEITGGPGLYTYTTTTEFAGGQIFRTVNQVKLQPGIKFAEASYQVDETAGTITVTVERTNSLGNQVAVVAGAADGTARAGTDYTAVTTTLTFDDKTDQQSFTLGILDDGELEGPQTILLTLADPSNQADIVDQGQVAVTIVDDEFIPSTDRLFIAQIGRGPNGPPPLPGQREWTFHKSADGVHPDANEQQMVWLMNRARANPAQEGVWLATTDIDDIVGAREGLNVDTVTLRQEFAGYAPMPPGAFDIRLHNAAYAHSLDLIARDTQDHDGQLARVKQAGFAYRLCLCGSVYSFGLNGIHAHAGFNIDWGPDPGGMQPGRGHRLALMAVNFLSTNVGVAMAPDNRRSTWVGPFVTSVNYATASSNLADHYNRFVVGTIWRDNNGDGMYSPGEGLGGVRIVPDRGGFYAITGQAGGYAIPITEAGAYTLSFDIGGGITRSVQVGEHSVLVDVPVNPALVAAAPLPSIAEQPAPPEGYIPVAPGPPPTLHGE